MKKLFTLALVLSLLPGCATRGGWPCWAWDRRTDQKDESSAIDQNAKTKLLIDEAKNDYGTNYLGIYDGMIAGKDTSGTVEMFSSTSGELLKKMSYEDFRAIFVLKTKAE